MNCILAVAGNNLNYMIILPGLVLLVIVCLLSVVCLFVLNVNLFEFNQRNSNNGR